MGKGLTSSSHSEHNIRSRVGSQDNACQPLTNPPEQRNGGRKGVGGAAAKEAGSERRISVSRR